MEADSGMRLIDAIHDHIARTRDAVSFIRSVANDLYAVGLDRASDNLLEAIEGLNESAKAISTAHMADVDGQIKHGEQIIGGMLQLALKGCIKPPKKSAKEPSE